MNFEVYIDAKIKETQKLLADRGFAKIDVTFKIAKLRKGVAGTAYPSNKHVDISEDYLNLNKEQVLNTTVPHEICHIYVAKYFPYAKQAHGPQFRHLMQLLGLEGHTYHSMGLPAGQTHKVKTVKRYVYENDKGDVCGLTAQKHKAWQNYFCTTGKSLYTKNGLAIRYTGKIKEYKGGVLVKG